MAKEEKNKTPRLANWLLSKFVDRDLLEEFFGDLQEIHQNRISSQGKFKAKFQYWIDALHLVFGFASLKASKYHNPTIMYKLNLLLSWRNLKKNRIFSLINIGGLALGMTVALLIGLWVQDELKYDTFHENYDRIHKVIAHRDFGDNMFTDHNMTFPYARIIDEEIPEVEHAVWTSHRRSVLLSKGEKSLKKEGYRVGGPYFQVFSWEFLEGNAGQALASPDAIVLTASSAKAFFGDASALNQTLTLNNEWEVTVSAVIQDPPANSTLDFDHILPYNYSDPNIKRLLDHWNNYSWDVYVQTLPNTDIQQLNQDLTAIMVEHTDSEQSTYFAHPMQKWHLHNEFRDGINVGGGIRYVRLFGIIAIVILLIACINFMNLSTARSQKRSMEVAVRKTLGSSRGALIQQFLTESTLVAFFAFLTSILAVVFLLPHFNQLVNRSLALDWGNPIGWLAATGLIISAGLLAGSYPAFRLSSFIPIKVLSGDTEREHRTFTPRRFLVVFQFVATITLISATILVFQQIQYIKNRDLGYDPDNLIMVPTTGSINHNFSAIKKELLQSGFVEAVNRSSSPITDVWSKSPAPNWPGRPTESNILFGNQYVDVDYAKAMHIDILAGRDFTGSIADSNSVLVNQAAVIAMGLEEPVGQQLIDGEQKLNIIGVIDDAVMESPFAAVEPLMVHYTERFFSYMNIRLKESAQPQTALSEIEQTVKQHNPAYPFEYEFVDQAFGEKLANEMLLRQVINLFAGLAIFISCLGLIGLVAYIIEKRMKEIAIRKVLGASQKNLLFLVAKEFLVLVVVALVIATPLAYFGIHDWLANYEYQVGINFWVFLSVGGVLLLLTLLIVGIQTVRAALENPINAIRLER